MKVYRGLPPPASQAPCALAIGNFDGVHRGHQALLDQVRRAATERGIEAAVMTFEPHPRAYFAHLSGDMSRAPTRISNLRDNLNELANTGINRVIVEHFNEHFAALSPTAFIEEILVKGLQVKWLMVGEDFRFGARRAGDIPTLQLAGKKLGFDVHTLPAVCRGDERISSSTVRQALALGDFTLAQELLGHSYRISGHVIHGQKLGRTLGFPTLNLAIRHQRPAIKGVFVVQVHGLGSTPLPAVASLGPRATVNDSGRMLLEVHVFNFNQNAYGKIVQVEFLKKLRDEEKYASLAELEAAIQNDCQQALNFFSQRLGTGAKSATDRI